MSKGLNTAQFTYDFGIAIAQSTVNKVARLAGVTLTLASAFYALKKTSKEYISTLRDYTLRFGGVLHTMKAMEQAQDRLIKGITTFSVKDQLAGMEKLMQVGIDVGKNMNWISKAAHATGKSYAEFSGMVASAIQGNTGALVEAGLMTQRATKMFDRYEANTVARQQAVMEFLQSNKALQSAIRNDFTTIEDQVERIKGVWDAFLQEIVGKPNDPSSIYGQVVSALQSVADGLAGFYKELKKYGYAIGQVCGWVIRQVGHFVTWLGRKLVNALQSIWKLTDDYQQQTKSLIVWLEFWKLKILDFLRDLWKQTKDFFSNYGGAIKTIIGLVLAYEALKYAFVIGNSAIASVKALQAAFAATILLQKRYIALLGASGVGGATKYLQSLAVWLPRPFRVAYIAMSKYFADLMINLKAANLAAARGTYTSGFVGTLGRLNHRIGKIFKGAWAALMLPFSKKGLGKIFGGFGKLLSKLNPLNISYARLLKFQGVLTKVLRSGFGLIPLAKSGFGIIPLVKFLGKGFMMIFNVANLKAFWGILSLVFKSMFGLKPLFSALITGVRAIFTALVSSNPVGWIMLAIGLLVVMYAKSKEFRVIVNTTIKIIWEALKMIYNLVVGIIVYTIVGFKKLWAWFKNCIWDPVANFFKSAYSWIGEMWKKFKDTSVGKFINKYIVTPIKTVFEWVVKAWNWVIKAIANVLDALGQGNTSLAQNINNLAKAEGLSGLAIATEGGTYDSNDDTNYLTKGFKGFDMPSLGSGGNGKTDNPLITPSGGGGAISNGNGGVSSTNLNFSNGAVQIVVEKGSNIDERVLAQKIKEVIKDLARDGNMRGGDI